MESSTEANNSYNIYKNEYKKQIKAYNKLKQKIKNIKKLNIFRKSIKNGKNRKSKIIIKQRQESNIII